jgi:hypothetical protein
MTDPTQYYRTKTLTYVLAHDLNLINDRVHKIFVDVMFPENVHGGRSSRVKGQIVLLVTITGVVIVHC